MSALSGAAAPSAEAAAAVEPKCQSFRELSRRPKCVIDPESFLMADTSHIQYRLAVCNGVMQMSRTDERKINDLIDNFETRDDDLFIATYVKSGTTWTQQIITLLLNNGEQGEKGYSEVVPWLESLTFGEGENNREAMGWTLDSLKTTPNRRLMKTHANLKDLPAGKAKGLKVLYVARNPKDVCVSLFHHAKNKTHNAFSGDVHDMLRCFVQGRCENGLWFDHVLEWWEAAQADPEHVLFLRYEDMLADPEKCITKIADFAGIAHTPELVAKTAENSTISAMKSNSKANFMASVQHLRKGGRGGWREVFTEAESEEFDKIYRKQMEGSGLVMDFGHGLQM